MSQTPPPPDPDDLDDEEVDESFDDEVHAILAAVPRPINWRDLDPGDAEAEWLELNAWVHWLRSTYHLPPVVVPPCWHRHPELVWELSALHLHWLGAFDPAQQASAPIGWHQDFAAARERLRDWTSVTGCTLSTHRPPAAVVWPGELGDETGAVARIENRESDFVDFVLRDVAGRETEQSDPARDAES
ncbi:MAG TPA: hypothetical protein VGC37_08590 [Friedmanniella sp.]